MESEKCVILAALSKWELLDFYFLYVIALNARYKNGLA
jgi:hypothetical protein